VYLFSVFTLEYPDEVLIDVTSQDGNFESSSDAITVAIGLNDRLNLSCFALNSRPAADVKWMVDDALFDSNLTTSALVTQVFCKSFDF